MYYFYKKISFLKHFWTNNIFFYNKIVNYKFVENSIQQIFIEYVLSAKHCAVPLDTED